MANNVLTGPEFTQLANNFYTSTGRVSQYERIIVDAELANYIAQNAESLKSNKIALVCICLNAPYWPYAGEMINGARKFFLPGHQTDFFLWSDMPKEMNFGATVFPTEPVDWPLPTLMRYHLFLQQEEILKEYDYIFYCDVDMKFVDLVGDEILGDGLTAAFHPMYQVRDTVKFPFEPNQHSTAYIKVPNHYYAGGLQGGTSIAFLEAMKVMKKNIDKDFDNNYMSRWNDESHWNKYLFDNPPSIILDSSYIYPDSLIKEYYEPIVWGKSLYPRLVTITKPFTVSKEGGEAVKQMIKSV